MYKIDLSIIIVNFNVSELLYQCLKSVFENLDDLKTEVIVVDNASYDDSVSMLESFYPSVKVIANEKNLGFAAATNQGLRCSQGDFILLLNPDTIVMSNAFTGLISFLDVADNAGVVGPKLLNLDGSLQPSCRSFPNEINMSAFSFLGYERIPRTSTPNYSLLETWDHSSILAVDYVIGAAFMLKREILSIVGLLDEDFFLYGEEKDWCYRIKKEGYKVYYFPYTSVVHVGGQSSVKVSSFSLKNLYKSHRLFLAKHYRLVRRLPILFILDLGIIFKAVVYTLRFLWYRTGGNWEKAKAYFSCLNIRINHVREN